MFSLLSRIKRLWPDKDRLLCNNELMGTRGPKMQLGKSFGSSKFFWRDANWEIGHAYHMPSEEITILAGAAIVFAC